MLQVIILGFVQGLTEFIPISSSAHLAILPQIFGWKEHGTTFDLVLHGGTLFALLIYFYKDLSNLARKAFKPKENPTEMKLIINIVISTIPALIFGFLLNEYADTKLNMLWLIGVNLIIVGLVMVLIDTALGNKKGKVNDITKSTAVIIGLSEVLALVRGISRSGITIITGMVRGLSREESARYSFLISIPIVGASFAYSILKIITSDETNLPIAILIVGFITSFITGFIAVKFLMSYLKNHSLKVFGIYRILLGIVLFIWILVK